MNYIAELICITYRLLHVFKGLVHPKMKNLSLITSPSCCSKPVRPSFIFRTQMKMFLKKSESYLTLHRQQHNWNVPRSRNLNTSVKQSMWHQWLNLFKLLFLFSLRKKKITDVFTTFLDLGTFQFYITFATVKAIVYTTLAFSRSKSETFENAADPVLGPVYTSAFSF